MLKVYGRANSINVRKVLWVLGEIGAKYERMDFGRGFTPTSAPEFLAVSRFGVVPVIDDDGFILRESNTITRYLAAKHKRADLYPTDLKQRALVEAWMDWAGTDLGTAVRDVFWGIQLKHPDYADPQRIERGGASWNQQMERLDQHLKSSGPYMMGKDFTLADIPVGLAVNRWYLIDFKKPRLDAVAAYYELLSQRAPYREHGRNGTP